MSHIYSSYYVYIQLSFSYELKPQVILNDVYILLQCIPSIAQVHLTWEVIYWVHTPGNIESLENIDIILQI